MQYYGTLGPACGSVEILERMFRAGMTGVRLNLSHGDLEKNGHWLDLLKDAASRQGIAPQILIDLQGPELRIGRVESEIEALAGETVSFGENGIPVPEMFLKYIESGDHFLLDDGKLEFIAESVEEKEAGRRTTLKARTLRGGRIKSEKSLALVGKELPMPTLTESDQKNIRLVKKFGVTGVMLPFVRNKEDLLTLRQALSDAGASDVEIFAKIENLQGVHALKELLPHADHMVIARGDLGNAMPLWELPGIQKMIAKTCREAGKPFMVVTQMLDSMHMRAVPTRAEVLDIYNAVLDGAASLMLTGETAAGAYPAEAMEYLVRTGKEGEKALR